MGWFHFHTCWVTAYRHWSWCVSYTAGGAALVVPMVMAYVGDIVSKGEEGKWMGYLNTLMTVGMGAGPLLGGAISDFAGPRMVFVAMGILYILGFSCIMLFLPESRPPTARKAANPSLKTMGASRMFWGLLAFWLVMEMSFSIVLTFLPLDGARRLGLSAFEIGILIAINTGIMALSMALTGKLADRFDRRRMAALGSLFHYMSMGCIVFTNSFWQLGVIMAVSGVGFAVAIPAVSALTIEEGRRHGMGTTNAWIMVGRAAGVAAGPIIAGAVNDVVGLPAVFIMASAIGFPAIAITLWLLRVNKLGHAANQGV